MAMRPMNQRHELRQTLPQPQDGIDGADVEFEALPGPGRNEELLRTFRY